MNNQVIISRLAQERKSLRQDRPVGFYAKPTSDNKGNLNLLKWDCGIQAKPSSIWSGVTLKLTMTFPEDFPLKPPQCIFKESLFHPNVFPSGRVCLSILNEDDGWSPSLSIKEILIGIRDLLDNPNEFNPAQGEPARLYRVCRREYYFQVKRQILQIKKNYL
jgi:ubiquitin-conjugating enzyme E2 I